jgi:hypothetical protein
MKCCCYQYCCIKKQEILKNYLNIYTKCNTIVNQGLRLNGEDIKRSSDFCYLGSIVAENGGTSGEVNVRVQKARDHSPN